MSDHRNHDRDWNRDDTARLKTAWKSVRSQLLAHCVEKTGQPAHWYGKLSTSALSTATAVMAIVVVRRSGREAQDFGLHADFDELIQRGLDWLGRHQNKDGGWGDTVRSLSNISTTMLAHAVFHAAEKTCEFSSVVESSSSYITEAGGASAVVARYGKDKTFSVPILTHCALAGLVEWRNITPLPFELSCLPAKFYRAIRFPVVSYALPALIAIGQVRHHHRPTWNPITRVLRHFAISTSLRVLERVQPPNGGFLEAAPLTSFVTMSLAGKGLVDHPVVRRGLSFLCGAVRADGSWPIDTNLATWTTSLSINALQDDIPEALRPGLTEWLLGQQYQKVHPYTNADPGGWAWTDLPGGVPDADDTPAAVLALLELQKETPAAVARPTANAIRWLLGLQNRDGGFPTFCRGWGTLPFDRSSPDITAHCLRALAAHLATEFGWTRPVSREHTTPWKSGSVSRQLRPLVNSLQKGLQFLQRSQRGNGSWVPLWFGNQFGHDDENPVYGTARVLMAYRDLGLLEAPESRQAARWLASIQHREDSESSATENQTPSSPATADSASVHRPRVTTGGWGGDAGIPPTVEETALAVEALLPFQEHRKNVLQGIRWLISRVEDGSVPEPSPIGFYFARLWYFEELYPLIFAASALRRAAEAVEPQAIP